MRKIVVDLMDHTNRPLLMMNMINIVKEHHSGFNSWLSVGPVQADVDGFNVLNAIADKNIEPGDFVIVLFEVDSFKDRTFANFVFGAFQEWGRITVYTEPTIVT